MYYDSYIPQGCNPTLPQQTEITRNVITRKFTLKNDERLPLSCTEQYPPYFLRGVTKLKSLCGSYDCREGLEAHQSRICNKK